MGILIFLIFLFTSSVSSLRLADFIKPLNDEMENERRDLGSSGTFGSFLTATEKTSMKNAYEKMFPSRKSAYEWDQFTSAWAKVFDDENVYTAWGSTTTETKSLSFNERRKYNFYRMVIFFWAHMAQETGEGRYLKEADCTGSATADVCCSYNDYQSDCNKGLDHKYFGRGSLQISHDENYRKFGNWLKNSNSASSNAFSGCTSYGSFEGCAEKLTESEYALLSGMWYFKATAMHLCGGSDGEDVIHCFKRTIHKINGQQECVARYKGYTHGYHNLGWGKCTQSGQEIHNAYIWKGYMDTEYGNKGFGEACRDACSQDSRCTGYNFSSFKNCIHWTASPLDDPMTEFFGWGDSFCYKKMPLRVEAMSRLRHLENAAYHLGWTSTVSAQSEFSCDFCDTFKTSNEPHQESPCYNDDNY